MFGIFDNKQENTGVDILTKEMRETRERFFVFIDKLEEKLKEFAEASVSELESLNKTDADQFKRAYHRMKAAVLGQIESIRKKATDVKEEKIDGAVTSVGDFGSGQAFFQFRNVCYDRYGRFDRLVSYYRQQVEETDAEDFEVKYQQILDEHEAVRNKFHCVQCGNPIAIEKIYFTTTYLTCSACQTRNTFEPGTRAKMLEHVGRSLAEQRTAHLLKEHDIIPEKTQELYLKVHAIGLSLLHERDRKVASQKRQEIEELKAKKAALENKRQGLYEVYLRAMFDEWNKINPALKEEHERFYARMLEDYKKYKI